MLGQVDLLDIPQRGEKPDLLIIELEFRGRITRKLVQIVHTGALQADIGCDSSRSYEA